MQWATCRGGHAGEVLGTDVQFWVTAFSPSAGTLTWTSWWTALGSLEAGMAALRVDAKYISLTGRGAGFVEEGIDDLLSRTITELSESANAANCVGIAAASKAVFTSGRGEFFATPEN